MEFLEILLDSGGSMIYKCKKCGFIHEGEMPDGYYCPMCRTGFNDFKLVNEDKIIYNRKTVDKENPSIMRIEEKCINCGACSKTCQNIVGINDDKVCIGCGQCVLSCPKAALCPKYDYNTVLDYINDPDYIVAVMTSPAVKTQIGDAFNYPAGKFLEGKMVASLKALGFDCVFDTTFGADLTSVEEAHELLERIDSNNLPMFSSCCPSWVKYANIYHADLRDKLSSCKSPIGMEATIIKEYYAREEDIDLDKFILVALTPCTSKKSEIINSDCDYVLTTSEISLMLKENNIDFKKLEDEKFDELKGSSSGTIFGSSGGVTLSVLRCAYYEVTNKDLTSDEVFIKNHGYFKEYRLKIGKRIVKCAVVNTIPNFERLMSEEIGYDFIEVMNCAGGCIGGGGAVIMPANEREEILKKRSHNLNKDDIKPSVKYAYKNNLVKDVYDEFLDGVGSKKAHKYLHL